MSHRGKELKEVTKEEEQAIREEHHEILVRSKEGAKKLLHLTDGEGDTLCNTLDDIPFNEKTFAMYPPRYKPICRRCATHWRKEE